MSYVLRCSYVGCIKKKLKSSIGFLSANKIDNYNRKGKKRKKKKIQNNLQNKSKHKNNNHFSWVTAVRVLSLAGSHSPPQLTRMPSNTVLISGPAVRAAQILIWSYSFVFLPPMSTAIRTSVFSFVGALNGLLYIPQTQSCLVDPVDLICSLYSWWEGLGSSSLATLPLGFNCGFISTSACGSSTGVLLLRLPWRACVCSCEGPGVEVLQLLGS